VQLIDVWANSAVFPTLADVVGVKTGSRSTANWRIHFIRPNRWPRLSFAKLIILLDIDGIGQNWEGSNKTQKRASLLGRDSPLFGATTILEKPRYGASPNMIGSDKLSQQVTAVHNSLQQRSYKLVTQGRDQVAKLPVFVRKETYNFGRSHQSQVRIFVPTVNGVLSSSTLITCRSQLCRVPVSAIASSDWWNDAPFRMTPTPPLLTEMCIFRVLPRRRLPPRAQ